MDPNIANIVEDNVLESGEQASVIQEDATDNLEVGIPAVTIETVANDNAVVEEYSQELDFESQPPSQYQPKTELQKLREEHERFKEDEKARSDIQSRRNKDYEQKLEHNVSELRNEIIEQTRSSITRQDIAFESMSKRQEVFRQQMQDSYDKLNARLEAMTLESELRVREINRVFHEQMFENENRYQQQMAIRDAEAERQRN